MKHVLLLAAALAAAGSAVAQTATLVPARSEIVFTTRQMGVPVEGRFTKFGAQVALDPKKPEAGQVALTIDTASARFGTPELDAEVGKPVWLSAARFPQATFTSRSIKASAPGRYEVAGTLTIKGADGAEHKATIWDRCVGCAMDDLDMPQEFFNEVTTPSGSSTPADGRAYGYEWSMN